MDTQGTHAHKDIPLGVFCTGAVLLFAFCVESDNRRGGGGVSMEGTNQYLRWDERHWVQRVVPEIAEGFGSSLYRLAAAWHVTTVVVVVFVAVGVGPNHVLP